MPIILQPDAPDLWSDPDLHALDRGAAARQDVRPLRIVLLNHAADMVDGDLRIARLLSNSPIQVEFTAVRDPTASEHDISPYLLHFYRSIAEVRERSFDAMVVVGPSASRQGREDIRAIAADAADLNDALGRSHAVLYIGGAALDALRRLYGIASRRLTARTRGSHWHHHVGPPSPLLRGHDHTFAVPVVDPDGVLAADITGDHGLAIVAQSEAVGVHILRQDQQRQTFLLNDITLDADALGWGRWAAASSPGEERAGGHADDSARVPGWSAHAQLVIANWLTHDVLPVTLPSGRGPEGDRVAQPRHVAGRVAVHPTRATERMPLSL